MSPSDQVASARKVELLDAAYRYVLEHGLGEGLRSAGEALWTWLAAREHRALLKLWVEAYARSLVEPDGPWATFAAETVRSWLAVLDDIPHSDSPTSRESPDSTLLLAVLRGALLDLLATGDTNRTTRAVQQYLETLPEN